MNRVAEFGLPADLAFDIRQSARSSISFVRTSYEHYLSSGTNFFSWNDPATPADETFDTVHDDRVPVFAHAENAGQGYAIPARRLMRLLEVFNEDLWQQYDPQNDTPAADEFRATLLVTALSHAFQSDLRAEFRDLHFPVDDAIYDQLMTLATPAPPRLSITLNHQLSTINVSWPSPSTGWYLQQNTNSVSSLNWSNVTSDIQDDGTNKTLIVNPPSGNRFYRLSK